MPSRKNIAELLDRRRKRILVHGIIYYKMNDNLISDGTWSVRAIELGELQVEYPEIVVKVPYAEEFKDFDRSTGINLSSNDPWAVSKARQLITLKNKGTHGQYEQLKIPI